jgi:Zn-dependent peptidase ImmA (M78 family)
LSPDLRLVIRKAKHHQLVLKQINENLNPIAKPIFKVFNLEVANKSIIANDLREYLGITKTLQQNFKNPELAFSFYRNLIEKNGISIFQYPLKEVRGFSLMDGEFPVIVINSGDSPNGKIFSLFHELCHILFNVGGIFKDFYSEELKRNPNRIEILCNQFASDILLPDIELLNDTLVLENIDNKEWTDDTLRAIASTYKVSKEVVLRKLLEADKTTQAFYTKTRIRWIEKYKQVLANKKQIKQTGPTYHVTNLSHLGKNFVSQVLTNYHSGKLTASQVADFLSIKLNKIPEYEKRVF